MPVVCRHNHYQHELIERHVTSLHYQVQRLQADQSQHQKSDLLFWKRASIWLRIALVLSENRSSSEKDSVLVVPHYLDQLADHGDDHRNTYIVAGCVCYPRILERVRAVSGTQTRHYKDDCFQVLLLSIAQMLDVSPGGLANIPHANKALLLPKRFLSAVTD